MVQQALVVNVATSTAYDVCGGHVQRVPCLVSLFVLSSRLSVGLVFFMVCRRHRHYHFRCDV